MDPGVRSHGIKANPPGYLWSKYECFLMSGWWDILHSSCFNVNFQVIPRTGRSTNKWKDENFIPCLPNDLILNQWLNKTNNLSVFRFRIRGAKTVNKPCIFSVSWAMYFCLRNALKIRECHVIAYGYLHFWSKYGTKEIAQFGWFHFHIMKVHKKLFKHMKIWEVFDSIYTV